MRNGSTRNGRRCEGQRHLSELLILAILVLCMNQIPLRADDKPTDLEVKAAFVLNFSLFATWERGVAASEALRIGFFEKQAEAAHAFVKVLEGRTVEQRPVRLIALKQIEAVSDCHIVYFGSMEKGQLAAAFALAERHGVLTVGESVDFLRMGGMLAFQVEKDRVRFSANPGVASRAGIQLSSKLLRLASAVLK